MLEFARSEQPDDPFAFRFSPQTYTVRGASGGISTVRVAWDAALLADLEALARPGCEPAAVQRVGEALRAILRPGGWDEHERAIAAALAAGREIRVVLRSAAAELYALPWELVTIGASGRYLAELPRALCVYTWPESQTAPRSPSPPPEGGRIVCAWSAAGGAVPAAEHVRAIAGAASEGHFGFDAKTDVVAHASLAALARALERGRAEGRPVTALHLLCHGGRRGATVGLWLDGDGDPVLVDPGDLRRLLAPHAGGLRLVVLAACSGGDPGELGNHLGSAAQALHRAGIEAVVASRFPLSVPGSVVLAEALYRTLLVELASVEAGVQAARALLTRDAERLDWASVQLYGRIEDGGDTRPVVVRPYRGLLAFQPEHRRLFFGREAKIEEIVADLAGLRERGRPRLLVVAGASGAGKSSLVLAGAAPRLLASDRRLELVTMRPGSAPLQTLQARLAARAEPGRPCLLVVDQLEELFSHDSPGAERQAFARELWRLAGEAKGGVSVIVTLRIDFVGACGDLVVDALGTRLDQITCDRAHGVLVAQMGADELREAIERPAAAVGLSFEPGLVSRILADLGDAPGGLPLLADTLDQLWARRDRRALTQAAYDALGGVTGSLERRAEALLAGLDEPGRRIARRILVRLVAVGREGAADVRQRVRVDALGPADPALARATDDIIAALVNARLAIRGEEVGAPTLELAHEALIRKWSRLQGWLREDADKLAALAELAGWVGPWKSHGTLLIGHQLGHAAALAERHAEDLGADARALVTASLQEAERRQTRRRRMLIVAIAAAVSLAVLAVVALALAVVARRETARADEGAQAARAAQEAADAAAARARDAALLSAARVDLGDVQRSALLLREVGDPTIRGFLPTAIEVVNEGIPPLLLAGHTATIRAVVFSRDGGWIASASDDGTTRVTRSDGREAVVLRHPAGVSDVAVNADASRIATAGADGIVRLWRRDAPNSPVPLARPRHLRARVAFSPDGQTIAAAGTSAPTLWRADGSGEPRTLSCGEPDSLRGDVELAWSPDGGLLAASCGGAVSVWHVARPDESTRLSLMSDDLYSLAFSEDGARIVVVTSREAAVFRVGEGMPIETGSSALAARFAEDGSLVAYSRYDLWRDSGGVALASVEPTTGAVLFVSEAGEMATRLDAKAGFRRLRGPPALVPVERPARLAAAWSPDGRRVAIAARDHGIRVWTLVGATDPPIWGDGDDPASEGLFRPGHDSVLVLTRSGAALHDLDGETSPPRLRVDGEFVTAAWRPDGARVALLGSSGAVTITDPDGGARVADRTLTLAQGSRPWFTYSPDGTHLAARPDGDGVLVWQPETPAEPRRFACVEASVNAAALGPDGAALALGCSDGVAVIHALAGDGAPVTLAARDGAVLGVAWSGDGQRLAVSYWDAVARIWRRDGAGDPLVLRGHTDRIGSLDWARDRELVVTASTDRTARLWSATDGTTVRVLEGHGQALRDALFSPDGRRVLTHAHDGTARVWSADGTEDPLVLTGAGNPLTQLWTRIRWSPDGRRVLVIGEGRARVTPVDPKLIHQWLLRHVPGCMSREMLESLLGDTAAAAQAAVEACARRQAGGDPGS